MRWLKGLGLVAVGIAIGIGAPLLVPDSEVTEKPAHTSCEAEHLELMEHLYEMQVQLDELAEEVDVLHPIEEDVDLRAERSLR